MVVKIPQSESKILNCFLGFFSYAKIHVSDLFVIIV